MLLACKRSQKGTQGSFISLLGLKKKRKNYMKQLDQSVSKNNAMHHVQNQNWPNQYMLIIRIQIKIK